MLFSKQLHNSCGRRLKRLRGFIFLRCSAITLLLHTRLIMSGRDLQKYGTWSMEKSKVRCLHVQKKESRTQRSDDACYTTVPSQKGKFSKSTVEFTSGTGQGRAG